MTPDRTADVARADAMLATALGELPEWFATSKELRGTLRVAFLEFTRLALETQRIVDSNFPTRCPPDYLFRHEEILRLSPEGKTTAQRRAAILAYYAAIKTDGSRAAWVATVSRLLGSSWSYAEHDPADPESPEPSTIAVTIPYAPDSVQALDVQRLLRAITPAHLEIGVSYAQGFIVGVSRVGLERL